METSDLIKKFVDEGAGKPLLNPMQQSILWIAGILLYLFVFLFFDGFRPGLGEKLSLPEFILELGILFLVGTSATFAAFCLSRPDTLQLPWIRYAPFPLLLIWALVAFASKTENLGPGQLWNSVSLGQFDCPLHILLFSTLPGIFIFLLVRMGAAIRYYWAGVMSTLSVTAFAYFFMRLVEDNDNPAHLLIWHALPIFLMCLIGMFAGRKALRWF